MKAVLIPRERRRGKEKPKKIPSAILENLKCDIKIF